MADMKPQKPYTARRHFKTIAKIGIIGGLLIACFDQHMGFFFVGFGILTFGYAYFFSDDPDDQGSA